MFLIWATLTLWVPGEERAEEEAHAWERQCEPGVVHFTNTVCGVRICQFSYWLKSVTPKSILTVLLWLLVDTHSAGKNLSPQRCVFPAVVGQGDVLPSCSSSDWKQASFLRSRQWPILHFCAFSLVIFAVCKGPQV